MTRPTNRGKRPNHPPINERAAIARDLELDDLDLYPALVRKGLKTFHLLDTDTGVAFCGFDARDTDAGAARLLKRRGLNLCTQCAGLATVELAEAGQ